MSKIFSLRNSWLAFFHDLLWVPLAVYLAFWLRFNLGEIPPEHFSALEVLVLLALPIQIATFWFFGLYRGIWRFASMPDLLRILKAVFLGVILTFVVMFIWQRLEHMPRSVLLLYPVILSLGLAVPRMSYRYLKNHHLGRPLHERKRALLIGAGQAGELLVRDLLKSGPYDPVGFLDDAKSRQGQELHGVRVIGGLADIKSVLQYQDIEVVLIAIPSASHKMIQSIVQQCQQFSVPCRTLPSVADLANGNIEVSRLRQVQIEDLLGRDAIRLDQPEVSQLLSGSCVLVTGAGGSIGSELCRQIIKHKPSRLILLDNGEFNLYAIEREIRAVGQAKVYAVLGDIRDQARMRWVFEHLSPDLVFNAAAYKHVPLVEENPAEGVKTNVLGTCQIADLAAEFGVEKFIQVSTDKAVNPTSVMGTTKRTAEIYCQNLDRRVEKTAFITTRFGNVLGSAGSVVPLFRSQIESGGPITITHPDITRYFMTIPEASSLILQAASMGQGGEIFVLDMGEPIKIADLAEQMIRLTGLEPGRDIEIVYTGLRPGEKLYEELFHEAEALVGTSHPKILLSGSREVDWDEMQQVLGELAVICALHNTGQLHQALQRLVPEFTPDFPAISAESIPGGAVVN